MHTSEIVRREHFRFIQADGGAERALAWEAMFPDYHRQDRVAVVCWTLEDGVAGAPGSLLALAHGFYDALRARGGTFLDYPQHFGILAGDERGIRTRGGFRALSPAAYGAPWGTLDVWPETMRKIAPPSPAGLLNAVFGLQIDRLFWPDDLPLPAAADPAERLPRYIRDMLATRLKQVWCYGGGRPTHRLQVLPPTAALIHQSREVLHRTLGDHTPTPPQTDAVYVEHLRMVEPTAFLQQHESLFQPAEPAKMS